jgi:agmatine deiminase
MPTPEISGPLSTACRMPAEWEPHESTWLAWPQNRDDWPGKFGQIPWVYVEIIRLLTQSEPVNLVVGSGKVRRRATDRLERAGVGLDRVRFFQFPTDRGWLRDSGPNFVIQGGRVIINDWRFNAWAKYENYQQDDRLPRRISRRLGLERIKVDAVLEGGAIDVNGLGTMLTTEECLLSDDVQVRNPGLDRADLERFFAEHLGIRHVIWLGRGIVGDDTHGHVDDIARFVDAGTIVTMIENDPSDANFEPLQDNLRRLQSAHDQDGRSLRIVPLPMPRPLFFEGTRLPASYANFYIANGQVLVPTFNDPADRVALATLAFVFPDREVIGIHAVDLVWGFGTLHCLTHEQPAWGH